jgi:hypothetical protein
MFSTAFDHSFQDDPTEKFTAAYGPAFQHPEPSVGDFLPSYSPDFK